MFPKMLKRRLKAIAVFAIQLTTSYAIPSPRPDLGAQLNLTTLLVSPASLYSDAPNASKRLANLLIDPISNASESFLVLNQT